MGQEKGRIFWRTKQIVLPQVRSRRQCRRDGQRRYPREQNTENRPRLSISIDNADAEQ